MSTFILIDADPLSFLISTLFVAAALFAMQTLHRDPPYYSWWSAAFAIGGLRYFVTYLVSITDLHITVFILDLLFIAQALLMLQGTFVMQERQQPVWLILLIGLGLASWGYIASAMSFSWALHDIPILGFYASVFLLSGTSCIRKSVHTDIPPGIRLASSALTGSLGVFYFIVLFLKPETNLHWIFIVEQSLLVTFGIVLVFAILSKLQNELHKTTDIDPASGAYTQRYFFNRIDEEIKRAQRYHRPLSMALLRIDQFENVSKTLDKKVRDAILRLFFENIRNALRDVDFTGLTDHGEFAIALPETDIGEARHVAERQLYRSKKMTIPGIDESAKPVIYITVVKSTDGDNAESIYLRAKNIVDDKIDDGIHPLYY